MDFKERFYSPSNAVFVIAGDIDIENTKELISHYFNELPNKGDKPIKIVPEEQPFEELRVQEFDPNIQIPALFYAFRTPSETERDSSVLDYISTYLSGGESSVLYKKLVDEKQMALEVQVFNIEHEDHSMFAILALPQGETSFDDLIKEIEVEINKIQEEVISEKDYQKIQNNLENFFVSSLRSVSGISQILASYHNIYGDASVINKITDVYRSISPEEIKEVANKYLKKNQRLIMEYLPESKK